MPGQGQPVWLLDRKMWGQEGGLWEESECVGDGVGDVGKGCGMGGGGRGRNCTRSEGSQQSAALSFGWRITLALSGALQLTPDMSGLPECLSLSCQAGWFTSQGWLDL